MFAQSVILREIYAKDQIKYIQITIVAFSAADLEVKLDKFFSASVCWFSGIKTRQSLCAPGPKNRHRLLIQFMPSTATCYRLCQHVRLPEILSLLCNFKWHQWDAVFLFFVFMGHHNQKFKFFGLIRFLSLSQYTPQLDEIDFNWNWLNSLTQPLKAKICATIWIPCQILSGNHLLKIWWQKQ